MTYEILIMIFLVGVPSVAAAIVSIIVALRQKSNHAETTQNIEDVKKAVGAEPLKPPTTANAVELTDKPDGGA